MGNEPIRVSIRVAEKDSAKAWGLLVRHSPGRALADRTFVISEDAVRALTDAGIDFTELGREPGLPAEGEIHTSARV
jgi:hypothetical protein